MEKNKKKIIFMFLLCLIFLDFGYTVFTQINLNTKSQAAEQGAWINYGLEIKSGKYITDGNRNPLYPFLLSLFTKKEIRSFTLAKLSSLTLSLITLLIFYFVGRKLFNPTIAGISLFFLACNWIYLAISFTVRCTLLFTLLFILSWYFIIKGFQRWKYWIIAGFLSSLAYLTKANGQILLFAFLFSFVMVCRGKISEYKKMLSFIIPYSVVSLVLWIYNYRVYGNPLYNFSITHAMWLEKWSDLNHLSPQTWPTIFSYFRTHSVGEIISRQIKGMLTMIGVFLRCLYPSNLFLTGTLLKYPLFLLGFISLIFSLVCFRKEAFNYLKKRKEKLIPSFILVLFFYLVFSWYNQVSPSERFLIPVIPIIYLFGVSLIYQTNQKCREKFKIIFKIEESLKTIGLILLIISIISFLSVKIYYFGFQNPFHSDKLEPGILKTLRWLEEEERQKIKICHGPSDEIPYWLLKKSPSVKTIPQEINWLNFIQWLKENQMEYLILDWDMLLRRYRLFSNYFFYQEGGIYFKKLPQRWKIVYRSPEVYPRLIIFQIQS